MKTVGFIGVGVMGKAMARNLRRAGFEVSIYTRTKSRVEDMIEEGFPWCDSVAACAAGRDVVITMVGYPSDVEQVYFGPEGIIENAGEGTVLIDMTTTDPDLSIRIYKAAQIGKLQALDAPVSGGDVGARNGTLSIMVGGDRSVFEACEPLFAAMGSTIILEGGPGAGQHTKMANQIALAGVIGGVCEALAYAQRVGLDAQTMLDTISQGAAGSWQMSNMAPRMLEGDFAPGFFIKHYIKDLNIARAQAQEAGLEMETVDVVYNMFRVLQEKGGGDWGTQALYKYYMDRA